jgi:hypothetical protein
VLPVRACVDGVVTAPMMPSRRRPVIRNRWSPTLARR